MALDKFTQITKSGIVTTINLECNHLYSTGIATFSSGTITAVDGTFSGDVSICGTLTYQDVTNVDAVGLITARAGVKAIGGEIAVGAGFSVGQAGVVTATKYYGDGSSLTGISAGVSLVNGANNRVITATGAAALAGETNLTYDGTDLVLNTASGDKAVRWATGGNNKWSIYHNNGAGALVAFDNANNAERFRIASDGDITHTGADNVEYKMKCGSSSGNNILAFLNSGGTTRGNITYDSDNDFLFFNVNQNERLRIASTGQVLIGETSTSGMSAYDLGMKNNTAIRFRKADGSAWINTVGLDNSNNLKLGWGGSVDEIHFGISGIGEQARFDSGGRLLIGTTASTPLYPSALQVVGSSGSTGSILIRRTDDGTPIFRTLVGQSGQNVANTSCVGNWTGAGYHTDGYDECAQITMNADGAVSNGTLPGRIVFFTHKAGTGLSEVMRLTQGGNIGVAGATGTDFSLLDGMVVNVANGSAGLLINSSSSSHNAYLGFSYGSGSSTSHADQFSAYIGRVGDNQLIFGTNNVIRGQVSPTGGLQWGLPGSSASLPGAIGALNVRAASNANIHIRNITSLTSPPAGSGVGIDVLNDASNTVMDLCIRGATTIFRNASAESLRIASDGKLFVGATGAVGAESWLFRNDAAGGADGCRLTVYNASNNSVNNQARFSLRTAHSETTFSSYNQGEVYISNPNAAAYFMLYLGGVNRFRVKNNGQTQLRKDSDCLRLLPTTSGNAVYIEFYDDGDSQRQGFFGFGSNTETTSTMHMHNNMNGHLEFRTNNTVHFRINNNGDLQGTDTSISSLSDSRLKKNVADFVYDLSKFKQFKPKTFEWINTDKHNSGTQRGFIAQDLEGVDAELTGETSLDEELQASDIATLGGSDKAKTARLGKNDTMYISVIQQLIDKIETLEAKVTALESS